MQADPSENESAPTDAEKLSAIRAMIDAWYVSGADGDCDPATHELVTDIEQIL